MSDDVLSATERADLGADSLMSVKDVASFLGVGRSTAYELMNAGRLAYVKIGRTNAGLFERNLGLSRRPMSDTLSGVRIRLNRSQRGHRPPR